MDIKKFLQSAITNGEIIDICYHGGSQPGSSRKISPIQILGNKLRARCILSNSVKTFIIEKIEILEDMLNSNNLWNPNKPKINKYKNLQDVYSNTQKDLEKIGYYTKLENNCYSLHYYFKNGNPKKNSIISIDYEEYEFEYDFDFESDSEFLEQKIIGKKKRQKPWVVRSNGETTRTFSNLESAVEFFDEQSKKHKP